MKKLERLVLEQVEKATRKNAVGSNTNSDDYPKCPYFLHQPKRPKK